MPCHSGAVRVITLQDIADRCGVSRITVSCALRGDRKNVSAAVMERIVQVARKMGYDPTFSLSARRLKYHRTSHRVENHLVALFFRVFSERYWTLIFKGINQSLLAERYGLMLCAVDVNAGPLVDQLPHVFRRGELDGAMIIASEDCAKIIKGLRAESALGSLPIVTIADRFPGCSSVLVDDYQIGYLAAAHLLDLGHCDLLCFVSKRFVSNIVRRRMAGYRQAFMDRRVDPGAHLHIAPAVWIDPCGLDVAMADTLRSHPEVTALMCPNDGYGIPMAFALRRLGYRIPEDLSVMGVDDSDEWLDQRGENIWTTVRLPLVDLGAESAQMLMNRIKGVTPGDIIRTLPVSLAIRATTRAPKLKPGRKA